MGPQALHVAQLAERLAALGYVVDRRDASAKAAKAQQHMRDGSVPENMRRFKEVVGWARALAAEVRNALAEGAVPTVLGGDHSLSMGSVTAAAAYWAAENRPIFVLWIDAHADFNTPFSSPSGNMHGMPLALICREPGLEAVFEGASPGYVPPNRVFLMGVRSIDGEERALLRRRGVSLLDMRRIDEEGVVAPLRAFLNHVAEQDGVLHVSFDLDVLDPTIAPGVGTAVPGGLTYREAHLILEMLHDSGRVRSVDLVELNPFLDERGKSATALAELAASLFGQRIFEAL
jgi:arginase